MKKKLIQIAIVTIVIFSLLTVSFIILKPILLCSKVTIENKSPHDLLNVVIKYENKVENLGTIESRKSLTQELHFKGETGVSLAYSINDNLHQSKEFYIEVTNYHVYFVVDEEGKVNARLEFIL